MLWTVLKTKPPPGARHRCAGTPHREYPGCHGRIRWVSTPPPQKTISRPNSALSRRVSMPAALTCTGLRISTPPRIRSGESRRHYHRCGRRRSDGACFDVGEEPRPGASPIADARGSSAVPLHPQVVPLHRGISTRSPTFGPGRAPIAQLVSRMRSEHASGHRRSATRSVKKRSKPRSQRHISVSPRRRHRGSRRTVARYLGARTQAREPRRVLRVRQG